jgi:transposase-like protein
MDCQATSPLGPTQSDLTPGPVSDLVSWPAQRLLPAQRQELAVQVLARTHPVAELARQHQVSRKFLYQQADTAQHALSGAFEPKPSDQEVLFYLPVTRAWLRQLILALVLICHSPYRAVVELCRDLFDWKISLGTVHNVVHGAVEPARAISRAYNLAGVHIGAHDEIFQAGHPVLVGVDTASTYCYLLSLEDHRDAETWGVRLLELVDQGFDPEATVADAGSGLRAGQALALPTVPCRGDLFHILRDLEQVVGYLENRAYGALEDTERRRRQLASAQRQDGRGRAKSVPSAAQFLRRSRATSDAAVALSDEVALLIGWLRHDVLAVAGPCSADRRALYDFVVAELKSRASRCPHRLGPICRQLENQRDDLLAFAHVLDEELERLGQEFQLPADLLRRLLGVLARDERDPRRWTEEAPLRERLRGRFYEVQAAVAALAQGTVRASSLVENLNSRLRSYFFLRRQLGSEYLTLLQFVLNHRRLERSDRPERVGKTPAELLTGQSHPHWLEMLGYTRFVRA